MKKAIKLIPIAGRGLIFCSSCEKGLCSSDTVYNYGEKYYCPKCFEETRQKGITIFQDNY